MEFHRLCFYEVIDTTSIDIVSGFLGAGKTTFISLLLQYYLQKGEKTVYIVNEFGNTGLDAALIKREGFQSVELPSGCICCTLKSDTLAALTDVIKTFSPSKIVFEPSGIFVFDNFYDILKDEFLRANCRIGRIITIVDTINIKKYTRIAGSFIENQIKNSDTLILSKLERSDCVLEDVLCDLHRKNPGAFVMAKRWNELTDDDFEQLTEKYKKGRLLLKTKAGHPSLQSVTLTEELHFTPESYQRFIEQLLTGACGTLLRVKGFLYVGGIPHLLNMAQQDVTLTPQSYVEEPGLTFIGEKLNTPLIKHIELIQPKDS